MSEAHRRLPVRLAAAAVVAAALWPWPSQAALIRLSDSSLPGPSRIVVFDDGADRVVNADLPPLTWLGDLPLADRMTYAQQLAFVAGMNADAYFGLTGWHLASAEEFSTLFFQTAEAATLFVPNLPFPGSPIFSGRLGTASLFAGEHLRRTFGLSGAVTADSVPDHISSQGTSAWIVTTQSPLAAPEPASVSLLAIGLAGLGALRRRPRRRCAARANRATPPFGGGRRAG